ncbi:hypothetical protein [Rhizobium sp. ERR 1071]|uniref:hypothetical protein n=1 Tax=Rhizobium sp. ERR 1071 TaxID=2572677 RepID=UPI001FEEE711|nr:hypothetical protein [Rhizobium sp. ERR1071]
MQILPIRRNPQKLLGISLKELFAFLLGVDLAGSKARHEVVLRSRHELLLEDIYRIHRRHDVGDVAMNLQGCRLVAGRLADHDRLDEITDDRHQSALGLLVGIVAGEEDQLADGKLRVGWIELRLQLRNLLLKILRRLFGRAGELLDQLLARDFQLIELVVEDGEARPSFGMPVLDLLHEARLL